jgi:anti-anti-sigma regulatory factor
MQPVFHIFIRLKIINLNIFGSSHIYYLVFLLYFSAKMGRVINLCGISPDVQEIITKCALSRQTLYR